MDETLCGVWVDDDGRVHLSVATADGGRLERTETLRPFAWLSGQTPAMPTGVAIEELRGEGPFSRLVHGETLAIYEAFLKEAMQGLLVMSNLLIISGLENDNANKKTS